MREYQHKKRIKKATSSIWFSGIILFLTLILFSSILGLYQKKKQVLRLSQESNQELAQLEEKTSRISAQLSVLNTNHGQEQMIREKYNIKSPGENVIMVMDAEPSKNVIEVEHNDFLYSIKSFFTNLFD